MNAPPALEMAVATPAWSEVSLTALPAALALAQAQERLVVVEFWAPDCLFSRLLLPTRTHLRQHYGERIVLRRCQVAGDEAACADLGVTGLPALLLFGGGRRLRRWVGEVHVSLVTRVLDRELQQAAAARASA